MAAPPAQGSAALKDLQVDLGDSCPHLLLRGARFVVVDPSTPPSTPFHPPTDIMPVVVLLDFGWSVRFEGCIAALHPRLICAHSLQHHSLRIFAPVASDKLGNHGNPASIEPWLRVGARRTEAVRGAQVLLASLMGEKEHYVSSTNPYGYLFSEYAWGTC